MKPTIKRPSQLVRSFRRVLIDAQSKMSGNFERALETLLELQEQPNQVEMLQPVVSGLADLLRRNRTLKDQLEASCLESTYADFSCLSQDITKWLQTLPAEARSGRQLLSNTLEGMIVAEKELRGLLLRYKPQPPIRYIVVPTDLLFQSFQSLFPAERMLVVAGHAEGGHIFLGASFDVTGVNSAGHVHADSRKLGQALIAMTAANTFLAAWLHSHPGNGKNGTYPSEIDRRQHHDWIRDYSPNLVSGIFVRDMYIRFWGEALENGQIDIQLRGSGIVRENRDEYIYRLNFG